MLQAAVLLSALVASHSCTSRNSIQLFEPQRHKGTEVHGVNSLCFFVYSLSPWFK
jgi:hypothetical protein